MIRSSRSSSRRRAGAVTPSGSGGHSAAIAVSGSQSSSRRSVSVADSSRRLSSCTSSSPPSSSAQNRPAAGGSPEAQVRGFIQAVATHAVARPHFPSIWLRELAQGGRHLDDSVLAQMRRIMQAFIAILAAGRRADRFRDVHPLIAHMAIVGPLLAGVISDRFGRRPTLIAYYLLSAAGIAMLRMAGSLDARGGVERGLAAARLLAGSGLQYGWARLHQGTPTPRPATRDNQPDDWTCRDDRGVPMEKLENPSYARAEPYEDLGAVNGRFDAGVDPYADLNGNGENDKVKFTLAHHSVNGE